MSWAVGYDNNWKRWVGYGVPSICDYPKCEEPIDRGLSYICGNEPYGGTEGCGLFFCSDHHSFDGCERCVDFDEPFTPTEDTAEWTDHILTDDSWADWRADNPEKVRVLGERVS